MDVLQFRLSCPPQGAREVCYQGQRVEGMYSLKQVLRMMERSEVKPNHVTASGRNGRQRGSRTDLRDLGNTLVATPSDLSCLSRRSIILKSLTHRSSRSDVDAAMAIVNQLQEDVDEVLQAYEANQDRRLIVCGISRLTERFLDKFSRLSFLRKRPKTCFFFQDFRGGFNSIFRFSSAFCVDCALFRPKRHPGVRLWAKTKIQTKH